MPAALGLVAVALAFGVRAVSDHYEHQFLSTGPNGPQTPMTFGAPFERVGFASGRRRLDGYLVRAPAAFPQAMGKQVFAAAPEPKALLIVHGFRHNAIYRQPETWWPPVIAFLRADPAASD